MYKTTHISKLIDILCSHYLLYIKIQNFHWNVEGPRFFSLHMKLEEQYDAFAEQNDEIAERIRMLGEKAPGSAKDFLAHSFIQEATPTTSSEDIVPTLIKDYTLLRDKCLECVEEASENGDEATVDLLVGRISALEKDLWMFSAFVK